MGKEGCDGRPLNDVELSASGKRSGSRWFTLHSRAARCGTEYTAGRLNCGCGLAAQLPPGVQYARNCGMAKFGAEKIWPHPDIPLENSVQNPQIVAQGGRTVRCAKSRLFSTPGSHGSQGPEFCTPDAVWNGSCILL